MSFVQHVLPNGLTIVIELMPQSQSAACGFLSRTGSRDDPPELAGVSHFLEHMLFKGTPTRNWEQINAEFDDMGALSNAWTSKDRTFYYGWVQATDLERQMALLADMMRPSLPADEFETERGVILEEIAMAADDLPGCAYDLLYEGLCAGTSLAWPILGTEQTVGAMPLEGLRRYHAQRYAPGNLVLVVAGHVEPSQVIEMAQRLCGHWAPGADPLAIRKPPVLHSGQFVRQAERFHQQAVILAVPSVSAVDPREETATAVAAIVGGENSRFYWNIMQQGLSTRAGMASEIYGDFGLIMAYGLCEPENAERLLEALRLQIADFVRQGPTQTELQRVKNLRRTSLANESEAPFYRLGQIAEDVDYLGRPREASERLAAVEAVDERTIREYLEHFPLDGQEFLISLGPRNWPA